MASDDTTGGVSGPLPEAARARVAELASAALGELPDADVPAALRRVARFEPRRRAKLAATQIAAHLEGDERFRERVADSARRSWPELAAQVAGGTAPPAAEPAMVAALAYLLRPDGWRALIVAVRVELDRTKAVAADTEARAEVDRLTARLGSARDAARADVERLRSDLRAARSEIADLRRKLHTTRERAKDAQARATAAEADAAAESSAARAEVAAAQKRERRAKVQLADAQAKVEANRRAAREGARAEDARLRVLLDTLGDALGGLRRELALPTTIDRPADSVAANRPRPRGIGARAGRSLSDQDPELLDKLLRLPQVHLVVDGYNVTKSGYPDLPLADQRTRLIGGLAGLAARTKAEVTCAFDGANVSPGVDAPTPRGVRVLFSAPGETADELIVRLVRAEPPGRPVVVVTSDQEIVDAVRRAGARPAASALLLRMVP